MTSSTSDKGNQATAQIIAALTAKGHKVWLPFGDGSAADLIVEGLSEEPLKVQCKTGRVRDGTVIFNAYSVQRSGNKSIGYEGKADLFAIYCSETSKVYLVPVNAVGNGAIHLRINKPLNSQIANIRWARDFEL